jgi:glucose/arabinose dehydrogenase
MSRIWESRRAHGIAMTLLILAGAPEPGASGETRTGAAAYGDWTTDAPGVRRHITPADLPPPFATPIRPNMSSTVTPPAGALPRVPDGFTAAIFATLKKPRLIRVAPNGDIFVAETATGKVEVLRAADGATKPEATGIFASGLNEPFGIAFYPAGPDPHYVYIANTDSVVRFPYRSGDLAARGAAETVVKTLPSGSGHSTRDIVFSPDDKRLFISVGSASNVAETMERADPGQIRTAEATRGLGAAWGDEAWRADVLETAPDGSGGLHSVANGIRNCVGLAIAPGTGDLWCATNERDSIGDNLPPDYVTRVRQGAFYGWPWYYIGDHEDPGHKGERRDLAGKITIPDVLIQPHSAPLELAFYTGSQFPADYRGDAFVALHGSWNRSSRTGYKIVRIILKNGVPTGEYEDFMTGFVAGDRDVWGRPVGVAVAHDGALLVSDDANGALWRVFYAGNKMDR